MTFNNVNNLLMCNELTFSDCAAPGLSKTAPENEALLINIRGTLMSVADLVTPEKMHACDDANAQWQVKSRLYARHVMTLDKAMMNSAHTVDTALFMILPQLPDDGGIEEHFFPALGTIAFWQDADGKYQLRAAGTDTLNGGKCRGWVFKARQLP